MEPIDAAPEDHRACANANAMAFAMLFALSLAFLFVAYCMARALIGGFGANFATIALSAVATAASSIFLWWLTPLADFAEIFWVHVPADRRARRGQCPHCGYPHESRATCCECGRATAPLPAWTLSARPVKRMAAILVPAFLLGCVAGEAWSLLDESRFAAEHDHANASVRAHYTRPRAFPATFARMWADESSGLHSEPWPDFARDRSWTPKDSALRERGLGWRERASTP